jgi:predicted MFS family arabinose efflux permease
VGRIISGTISDRVNHALLLRLNIVGAIIGAVFITANFNPIASAAGQVLVGFTLGPLAPTLYSDTVRRVGTTHAPATIGFQNVGAGLGMAAAPAIGGILAEAIGLEMIGPYIIALACTALFIHELIIGWERRHRLAPQPV